MFELKKTEGRVAIYLNDRKIWPKDADYAAVKQGESVDFPELALDLKKGDVILIEGYGAMPGEDITGDTGGEWQNQILLDPVICVQREDGAPEAGSSAVPALTALIWPLLLTVTTAGAEDVQSSLSSA